jgi:hypothetical protein
MNTTYTDATKISNYLQRSLSTEEAAILAYLIPAIQKWIDNYTGSTFGEVVASTRYFEGGGTTLDIDPATEITAVNSIDLIDGVTNSYTYIEYQDYTAEPRNSNVKREIVKRRGRFYRGVDRIAVTAKFSEYDGAVPEDIVFVATRIAASILLGAKSDSSSAGLKRESLEGHSVDYATSQDSISTIANGDPLINSILDQHREILIG